MNFQEFVDGFQTMTCVISVQKKDNGYGEIRMVAANPAYVAWIEHPTLGDPQQKGRPFVPGLLYDTYIPKDLNFEDLCYRAAVLKKPIHTYAHPNITHVWFNLYALPVAYEEGDLCYCTYTLELCELADINLMSLHSLETSADVLKTCIRLHDTTDFKKTMKEIIRDIRVICDAAVCTIMLMDFNSGTADILATDIKEGSRLKRVTQFVNFYDIAASWIDTIGDSDCLIIKNEQDMEYISRINNPWYLTLAEAGVYSVVMFPLRHNNEVLGYIWATNFDTRTTMRIKETLELTTFFLSSEIASYRMLERLEHISFTDMLTGVRNRNAMNNRITDIVEGNALIDEPYGIIFADLNGLKRVNDTYGHSVGDLLLKKAAILLQEILQGDSIYRAGGDEFMAIVSGCDREAFGEKVQTLKERSAAPDQVCFAIGSFFNDRCCDIRDAMRQADENMYRHKDAFYQLHPELANR